MVQTINTIFLLYFQILFSTSMNPDTKYIINEKLVSTNEIQGLYKYNFEQFGSIEIKTDSYINYLINLWKMSNKNVSFLYKSSGNSEIVDKNMDDKDFYQFNSSGDLILGCETHAIPPLCSNFFSIGFLKLYSIIGNKSILEASADILDFQFKSSGKITFTLIKSTADYTFYHFESTGTMELWDNQRYLKPIKIFESKIQLKNTKEKFIEKIIEYLKNSYWKFDQPNLQEVKDCLGLIFDNFKDFDHLCIFTANTIFSTSGFLHLKQLNANKKDIWWSRGIIMLTTEPNYLEMARLINDWKVYNEPDCLASLTEQSVSACLKFYNYLIEEALRSDSNFKINWINVLKVISPEELEEHNKVICDKRKEEYDNILKVLADINFSVFRL